MAPKGKIAMKKRPKEVQDADAAAETGAKPKGAAGPLAGKVRRLLPPSLDLGEALAAPAAPVGAPAVADSDSDDEPPEEVSNAAAAQDVPPSSVGSKDAKAASGAKGKFWWQESESRELLGKVREQDERRRAGVLRDGEVQKHGFNLVRLDRKSAAKPCLASAKDFLSQELIGGRKRVRTRDDKYDRRTLSVGKMGVHIARTEKGKGKGKGKRPLPFTTVPPKEKKHQKGAFSMPTGMDAM